jgi:hypothetical protein
MGTVRGCPRINGSTSSTGEKEVEQALEVDRKLSTSNSNLEVQFRHRAFGGGGEAWPLIY